MDAKKEPGQCRAQVGEDLGLAVRVPVRLDPEPNGVVESGLCHWSGFYVFSQCSGGLYWIPALMGIDG